MYYCRRCKKVFEEPDIYRENHGFDFPPYERIAICPYCGNDDFVETIKCYNCDGYITGKYIKTAFGDCYCQECFTNEEI